MGGGGAWPRISVITFCYNQGRFIEEAIRSVLLQGYPDLEYVIADGASTDGTVEVIRKYEPWLARWTSAPDRGPAHALNVACPGLTGELIGLMASDDLYLPEAFRRFAEAHAAAKGSLLVGAVEMFRDGGEVMWIERPSGLTLDNALNPLEPDLHWNERGLMVPAAVFRAAGPFDETLRYCTDQDQLCRLLQHAPVAYVDAVVARFRVHPAGNTATNKVAIMREWLELVQRYWHVRPRLDPRRQRALHAVYEASMHLARHPMWAPFWNRRAGGRLLLRAAWGDPRIVGDRTFRQLARRALIPRRWLRSSPWEARG